jgi:23S rRNA pseudouridine1911/1915/1917 synthase
VHAAGRAFFKAHRFERTYLALVSGVPEPREGTIDRAIGADYLDGRRALDERNADALPARTHYRVLEQFGDRAALVEVTLDTGRQHQIRLHLSSIGHPVLDDRVYGPERGSARPGDRPLLHAWRLAFPHPLTGRRVAVTAEIPRDFRARVARLSTGD